MDFNGGVIVIDRPVNLGYSQTEIDKETYEYFMNIFSKGKPVIIKYDDGYAPVLNYRYHPQHNSVEFCYIEFIDQTWTIYMRLITYNKYQQKYFTSAYIYEIN